MSSNVPNGIVDSLRYPKADILSYLDQLASQVSFATAASDSDLGNFGSGTMSRRNSKVFIIGFIPPDNPINFVPYSPTSTQISSNSASSSDADSTNKLKVKVPDTGNGGQQEVKRVSYKAADLRNALRQAYINATGNEPSEATLALIYAQCLAENGSSNNPDIVSSLNNNLGSTHAHGQTIANFLHNDTSGLSGTETEFVPPTTGTWFIGRDSTKGLNKDGTARPGSTAFRVAFNSFSTLQDGANFQVANLLHGWPGTANAQTAKEFVDATKKTPGRSGYFGLNTDEYQRGLESKLGGYATRFSNVQSENPDLSLPANFVPGSVVSPNVGSDPESDDPLGARLGRNIQLANADRQALVAQQISAVQQQINLINFTPPLLMLINPSEFTRSYEYSVDDGAKTRQGHIVQMWLERPVSISGSGVTAGQYVYDANGNGGLNNTNRIQSISYKNLFSLVMTYKNNGILFAGGEVPGSQGVPILAMSLYIYYDDHIYIGTFDEFSVNDEAEKPFNMSYDFKFNVRYDIELDGINTVVDNVVSQNFGAGF